MLCANCGIAQVDDIKLKICDGGCDLAKYCSDKCQKNHRDQHEEGCNQRKAELHDKQLFEQPDGAYLGECPLCFLPLPIGTKNLHFIHAAAKRCVKAVRLPITKAAGEVNVHSAESRFLMVKKKIARG